MKKIISVLLFFLLFCPSFLFSQKKDSITIFRFLEDGKRITSLSEAVTDAFEIALLKTGEYKIIEKKQIDKVLAQQGFQSSGLTDDSQAVEVGRILNSQYIIVGSLNRLSEMYVVSVRMINITTGEIEKGESIRAANQTHLIENMKILAIKITGEGVIPTIENSNTKKNAPKGLVFLNSGSIVLKYRLFDHQGKERFNGETPNSLELPFGSYVIKATDPTQLYKDFETTFLIENEKKIIIPIQPEKNFYILEVKGYGGTLFVDGKEEGSLPFKGKVSIAKHHLKVYPSLSSYKIWEKEIDPPASQTFSIFADLELIYLKRLIKSKPDLPLSLYINNKWVGTTPDRFMIPCGVHDFLLEGKDLSGNPIRYSTRLEILPQMPDSPIIFNVAHLIQQEKKDSYNHENNSIGKNATIRTDSYPPSSTEESYSYETTSLFYFLGISTKYFTEGVRHYIEPGISANFLWKINNHYINVGGLIATHIGDLSDIGLIYTPHTSLIGGLDLFYKYRFDLISIGLHWMPGIAAPLTNNNSPFLINDLAASIAIEIGDAISIYYKVGTRVESPFEESDRIFAINEIGISFDAAAAIEAMR